MDKTTLKHSILSKDDKKIKKVNVPEWGVDVHLKTLSFREVIDYNSDLIKGVNQVPAWLIRSLCHEDGTRLYEDSDLDALVEKNWQVLQTLFEEAQIFNPETKAADEEREKN